MNGFPDDVDHYLRAVGVAGGQVLGEPNPVLDGAEVPTTKGCCVGPNPAAEYWVQAGLRKVTVPGDVRPELIDCASAADRPRFGCGAAAPLEAASYDTLMGTIEPAGYLASGAALAVGDWGTNSFRVARLVTAWLAVLAIGLVLRGCAAGPRFARRVVGLCIATTPMVVFVLSSASPNAVETAGAIGVWLAVLELTAEPGTRASRWLWAGFALSGVLLVSARSLGPIWLLLVLAIAFVLRGHRPLVDRVRTDRVPALVALVLTGLAAASTVIWEAVVQPSVLVDTAFARSQFFDAIDNSNRIAREVVGTFGSIDLPLPRATILTWLGLVALAVVVALITGAGRGRAAVVVLLLAAFGAYLVIDLLVMRQNGFVAQGRHLLAAVVGVPILAVEVVRIPAARWRRVADLAAVAVAVVCGALQLHSWAFAATSWAPTERGLVLTDAFGGSWSYPDPTPLIVVAVLSAAAFATATAATVLGRPPAEPDHPRTG
jgi:hypothetical protein